MRTERYGDQAMEELAAARDSDALCRLLFQSPWGWGSSTRHEEAVSRLRGLRSGIARVRRAALDRLCELDGPGAALRRAGSDADQTVRVWRPPGTPAPAHPQLPGITSSLP
jgi:hypothetical protein